MTTGELLNQESTVSNVSALTHLQNLSGTGSGVDQWFPYNDITIAFEEPDLKVAFEEPSLLVDLVEDDLDVNLEEPELIVTFDDDTNDIILTC